MNAPAASELSQFHRFVGDKIHGGDEGLSPEQVLDEYRANHPDPAELENDLAAIQEAIDDMANGDVGMDFEEFDRDFRARRGLPPQVSAALKV